MDSKELVELVSYRLKEFDVLQQKLYELKRELPNKTCSTCSCIDCNNSMEWECDPVGKAKHWNPSLKYIKQYFKNVKVL